MIDQRQPGEVLCRQGHVPVVSLNRPEALKTLTVEMDELYRETLAEADRAPDVRAVVVTGVGQEPVTVAGA